MIVMWRVSQGRERLKVRPNMAWAVLCKDTHPIEGTELDKQAEILRRQVHLVDMSMWWILEMNILRCEARALWRYTQGNRIIKTMQGKGKWCSEVGRAHPEMGSMTNDGANEERRDKHSSTRDLFKLCLGREME